MSKTLTFSQKTIPVSEEALDAALSESIISMERNFFDFCLDIKGYMPKVKHLNLVVNLIGATEGNTKAHGQHLAQDRAQLYEVLIGKFKDEERFNILAAHYNETHKEMMALPTDNPKRDRIIEVHSVIDRLLNNEAAFHARTGEPRVRLQRAMHAAAANSTAHQVR